ncbi:diguanylate cyclase/phosphodiesterase [Salmonella enterica subsp. arizonae]|uniref:Diguanylate cyclase/phosphodiesterase n=1 Tax=Salmonella enterica subsp. arizonae TaxID=59203 RepID=A0A3S4G6X3_SALER|nr:diguanylate cyclase/phosphodiesterase [Salmonella enterica subsp. arizonae]
MSQSTRRKVLKFLETIIVVLLPVLLALWFAHSRAVSETRNQLHSFAQWVLDKTELVILQADLAAMLLNNIRDKPVHQPINSEC